MSIVILLGPPGSGKGTQAELLESRDAFLRLSTGDLLRHEIMKNTDFGMQVKSYIDKGLLVPDELVTEFILNYIEQNNLYNRNVIFDGFPRRISQAEALRDKLREFSKDIDMAILIDLPENKIILRLASRKGCPQGKKVFPGTFPRNNCDVCGTELTVRSDDKRDTISNRLDVYMKETSPLVEYFEETGILQKIDGEGSIEEVYKKLRAMVV